MHALWSESLLPFCKLLPSASTIGLILGLVLVAVVAICIFMVVAGMEVF